jgi:hypothetical protein
MGPALRGRTFPFRGNGGRVWKAQQPTVPVGGARQVERGHHHHIDATAAVLAAHELGFTANNRASLPAR